MCPSAILGRHRHRHAPISVAHCSCRLSGTADALQELSTAGVRESMVLPFVLQVLTRIRGFAAMNRLKKEALKVIAGNLPVDEIVGLKEMFHAMDKDDRSVEHGSSVTCCW